MPNLSDSDFTGVSEMIEGTAVSEAELTALAIATDPDAPLDTDAIPLGLYLAGSPQLLPQWYMPLAMTRGTRWRTAVVVVLIAGFLLIDAAGLCSTYGHIVIA